MANEAANTGSMSMSMVLTSELNAQRDALPKDLNITRFVNNAIALLNGNDAIKEYVTKYGANGYAQQQVKAGLIRGAYLGLDALNQEMYLVPYGAVLNFMPSYKGMVKLCMKYSTRDIKTIYAKVVREGDEFSEEIINGEPSITFKPLAFNTKHVVGAFAVCLYKDGGMIYEVMSLKDLEQCRKSSKAQNSPAWSRFETEMYKKTVMRRLAKSIPLDMDEKLSNAMNAGLELETDPAELAKRDIEEHGNTEELIVDAEEVNDGSTT